MGKIITVTIQKGGSGKTTCSVNLAACFAHLGKKVLVVDLDYQANATELLNIRSRELKYEQTIGYAIQKSANFNKIVMKTNVEFVDVLPGSNLLEDIVLHNTGKANQSFLLDNVLSGVRDAYDLIVIDTNPNPDCLFQSALRESDYYMVPLFAENDVIDGLATVINNAEKVRQYLNKNLKLLGCVIQKFDKKSPFQIAGEKLIRKIGSENSIHIFETLIPFSQMIYGASMKHQALILYKEKSPITKSYLTLTKEIETQMMNVDSIPTTIIGATVSIEKEKYEKALNTLEIEEVEV